MSWGKMTFGEKCRSQGYYGKKWGKMFFGEKCRREKCRGEKRLWGKLSCTRQAGNSSILVGQNSYNVCLHKFDFRGLHNGKSYIKS